MATKVQRIMTQPINLIFRFLQTKSRVRVWLYENAEELIEGQLVGFDEYMNLVLDHAEEVDAKKKTKRKVGRLLLRGDCVTALVKVS